MTYRVKEIFYTLQGEGAQAGRPAVFCRFSGCNLWSGREVDRGTAICRFCDTNFFGTDGDGGGTFETAEQLANAVAVLWPSQSSPKAKRYVVCTGGEPLLQLDSAAVEALHDRGFEVAVETNGTRLPPEGVDWICVSPKAGTMLVLNHGSELKLVYPQIELQPDSLEDLEFSHFFLQPMDGLDAEKNTQMALAYCLKHPQWRLSLQTHKLVGIR
jgi:7-carboxy-7-deazaguanine synthase